MHIAIFHGNERWILRGLAIDIETALKKIGASVSRHEVDLISPGEIPKADWFFFVQQGQLNTILRAWGYREDLIKKSICIFTHFDVNNCNFSLLNKIHLISHMSSHQMAIAIGNGLSAKNSKLLTLGVKMDRHFPLKQSHLSKELARLYPEIADKTKRSYVGFCTRITTKSTYTKRKNYESLIKIINNLASKGQKILILGDGWEKIEIKKKRENVLIPCPPYEHYNLFYNLMKVFVSVTSYDGGPIPLLESMACGVPSVITNSGFVPDVINSKELGLTFQPFESEDRVIDLIRESSITSYDRTLLRNRASMFSFDNYARRLLNILNLK